MTKKDYEQIAEAIEQAVYACKNASVKASEQFGIESVTIKIANALGQDNPRFDHDKFYEACGVDIIHK